MRRAIVIVGMLMSTVFALRASAQSLPSKREAVELYDKAKEQSLLALPGHSAFHVVANLHYVASINSADGSYEVLWAAPSRFREEFRLGVIGETDVALENKLYVLRNTATPSEVLFLVQSLTGLPNAKTGSATWHVSKVYSTQSDGKNLTCFDLQPTRGKHTACLDSTTNQLVSDEYNVRIGETNVHSLFNHYLTFGSVNYPAHVQIALGSNTLEISVRKVEQVDSFADHVFVPPSGAAEQDWCAEPEFKNGGSSPPALFGLYPPQTRQYYIRVGTDGHVAGLVSMGPTNAKDDPVAKAVSQMHFAIKSCGGKPVEYEALISPWLLFLRIGNVM